ncbi:hypothetical protein HDU82_007124 [Entophlyctis luteolus]|nr:hypothetical protein HDU82_007124 [Entophlyctis luteolus]
MASLHRLAAHARSPSLLPPLLRASRRTLSASMQLLTSAPPPKKYDPFANAPAADPEPLHPSASEIWSRSQLPSQKPLSRDDVISDDDIFAHPLYTPAAKPFIGIGKLLGPMQYPEYDQSGFLAGNNPNIKSPPGPDVAVNTFEDALEAPIGDYPRIPHQWTELKDPFKYWDQQGRRNYGDILADQELQMNQWTHGPATAVRPAIIVVGGFLFAMAGLFAAISAWDPEKHLWQAQRDYPFNGLHLELGADPNDLDDTAITARQYKNQFDSTYKSI